MMKQILAKFREDSRYKFLAITFLVIEFEHLFIREYTGDAAIAFSHYLDRTTLFATLHLRFTTWTSRVLIEAVLLKISQNMHIIIWAMIDILMWMLLTWSLMKLTNYKRNYLIMSLVFFVPLSMMNGAGWMATSINYFWPLALGTFALISLYKIYHHEKMSFLIGIVMLLGLVFATNFETYGVMYLCILSYFSVMMLIERRISFSGILFVITQYAICFANIGLALIAPGNKQRVLVETKFRMLDFASMTPFDKLVMGFNHTFSELTDNNIFFLFFSMMLVIVAFSSKKRSRVIDVASWFPISFIALRTVFAPVVNIYAPEFGALFGAVTKQQRVDAVNYFDFVSYIPFITYVLMLIVILLVLINSFEDLKLGTFLSVAFLSGLLTSVAVGFSPSIYASGSRIFFFIDFVLIYAITMMYSEISFFFDERRSLKKIVKWSFCALTIFAIINNLIAIGATYYYGSISF